MSVVMRQKSMQQKFELIRHTSSLKVKTSKAKAISMNGLQPSIMIPGTQNRKKILDPTRETCILGIMATLAFSCRKSISQPCQP